MKNPIQSAFTTTRLVAVFLLAGHTLAFASESTVKLNGAPPVGLPVKSKQSDIEATSGAKIEIMLTNNPRGIDALRAGEADLALLAPSLKKVVDAMNAAKPGSASADGLQEFTVGEGSVSVIVHPGNTVGELSTPQVRDLLSGKITNWKDVGGADLPVQVFVLDPSIIPRIVVDDHIMAGTPVTKSAVVRSKPGDMPTMVAQTPGAISFTGTALVTPAVKTVKLDQALKFPMIFASKGEPSPAVKAVIDAAKATLATAP